MTAALRIALAQINATVGDLEGNRRLIEEASGRAGGLGCHLAVFPELALTGYPPEDLLLSPGFLDATEEEVEKLIESIGLGAASLTGPTFAGALVGAPSRRHQGGRSSTSRRRLRNAALLIGGRTILAEYAKRELPNYGVFDERRYFTPGRTPVTIEHLGIRMSVTICEDLWIDGGKVEADLRAERPEIVLNLAASPFHAEKDAERLAVLSRIARAAEAPLLYCNLVGGQDELIFDGGSLAMDATGAIVARAERFAEDLLVFECAGRQGGKPASVRCIESPAVGGGGTREEPPSEILAALVLGTRDYVVKNGFERVVLGLSGGIDSALVAAIAVEALGAAKVTGVTMPSRHTSKETLADAHLLAGNLGIECLEIPIDGLYQHWLDDLAGPLRYGKPGIEAENLQSRIRGTIIMTLSNRFGWLALTTGNKSETAMGYCTLYGDMAGGFAVLKDVFKGTVYALADEINRRAAEERPPWHRRHGLASCRRAVIPESTIRRAPSAELRPDQKDEDSLPPYPVLDPILREYVENDLGAEEIARLLAVDVELVRGVIRTVDRTEFKRRQAPPGIRITPRAFGRDRRMPITNRWKNR
jgi:NAD+ synthase (glutamine-hydrolysing)